MASSKRIGFFWGEEKITIVEFEKNVPTQVVSSALASKTGAASPFSTNLTEEIQTTVLLKKLMQDFQVSEGLFYISLPMKEIILRSFVIPFVKPNDVANAIKFEAKKYVPFEIGDLSYVFHTIPFMEGLTKRLQVIFFAARKEVLVKYDRIFKQIDSQISIYYCEPYIVSLAKALLYRKEIGASEHIAFLVLDKNMGRICFIDKGIPQFIREFPIASGTPEESIEPAVDFNMKIVNEVLNSFDFYGRQFSGEKIERILVSSEVISGDLTQSLETELKVKIIKFTPIVNPGAAHQTTDMDAIYAMGACVASPIESLSKFNFLGERSPKVKLDNQIIAVLKPYMSIVLTLVMSLVILVGVYVFFQMQLKLVKSQYTRITAQEGVHLSETQDSIQTDVQTNTDLLAQYKGIRVRSDVSGIVLRIASHIPKGALLRSLNLSYNQTDTANHTVTIEIQGMVVTGDFTEQITVVNQMFADFKNDKALNESIKDVNLVSLNRTIYNNKQATEFTIHFS